MLLNIYIFHPLDVIMSCEFFFLKKFNFELIFLARIIGSLLTSHRQTPRPGCVIRNIYQIIYMIFNFRVVSDEVDNFKREVKIDADMTFLDLKNAICDCVGYDKNQMCSFFLCDRNWEKEKEITFEDMGSDSDQDVWLMDDTILSDFIEDEGQKMMFVFDYMTDRAFFMELKEIITGKTLKDPVCTLALGQAPPQNVDLDEFDAKVDAKVAAVPSIDDLDEEFYGEDEFNPDEFDEEGFDEMTFND